MAVLLLFIYTQTSTEQRTAAAYKHISRLKIKGIEIEFILYDKQIDQTSEEKQDRSVSSFQSSN